MNHEIQIALVLSTITIAIITFWGIRQSNNLLKKDLQMRYRPSLARLHMNMSIEDYKWSYANDEIIFRFINNGLLPAINIRKKYYTRTLSPKTGEFVETYTSDEVEPNGITIPSMAINESMGINIPLKGQAIREAWIDKNFYFGLLLEYTDENKTPYYYKMLGHLEPGGIIMLSNTEIGTGEPKSSF